MNSQAKAFTPTPLQQACLARTLLSPAGGHYIQQLVCDWAEPLEIDAWVRAWNFAAARHDALRAFFRWESSGQISEFFAETVSASIEIAGDITEATLRQEVLSDFLNADRRRGFNLAAAPLWRLTVFRWTGGEATTVWTFHHALLDGRSHERVWEEVDAAYRHFLSGTASALPAARSYTEFVTWLAANPEEEAVGYWRERLQGFQAPTDLPTLWPAPDSGDDDLPPAVEALSLAAETAGSLREAARRHDVTLNNLVQGAWALALARYQGVEEVAFGVVRSCRHWTEESPGERVGMFINTVPFRVDATPAQRVGMWLKNLRSQQLAARAGEYASAEQIRRWCGLSKSAVLYRNCMMFENHDPGELMTKPGQRVRLVQKTDLPTLAVYAGRTVSLTLDFSPRRHPAAQARLILKHVKSLLEALAAAPGDLRLEQLQMLTSEERRLIFEDWQGPLTPQPAPPLHRVLEAQALRSPDAPAVEFQGRSLDYKDFHRQSNQLARRLLQFCRPGDRAAVVLDRSLDQPMTWLACLKAGVVYTPVDPVNPGKRLEFIFKDLKPAALLTQQALLPLLPTGTWRVLCLDSPAERAEQAALDAHPLDIDPPADAPVNLLYTSGSTGSPKAAINIRAGLDNVAVEISRTFNVSPADRVLQSSSTSFDVSLFDYIASLQSGATLVLAPAEQLRSGPKLTQLLVEQCITAAMLTPTVMRSTPVPPLPALRIVAAAGEPLTLELLETWSAGRRMFNAYGPTECSLWATCDDCHADGYRPTVGRPVLNCRAYVLDENQQPVPVGVPGELYLGGICVGSGYWNRPELTAERYLPDPFAGGPGARMYRTGDRARWLADGRIEFLGRLDFQVKVHGVRLELGEIETAMRRHPAVADAVVVWHDDELLAWFIPSGQTPTDAVLRAWLSEHIPLIFMPAEFHSLPQFPRTLTGKVNRTALLEAWLAEQTKRVGAIATGLTAEERRLVLEDWNRTGRPYPLERSVVEFFHEQVRQWPQATALKRGARVLSYGALNRWSNGIAQDLLRAGLQPEDVVALRFDRSMAYVASALAVLKAGGSYLPLDAHTPAARQEFIFKDSGARFALMAGEFLPTLAGWAGRSARVDEEAPPGNAEALNPDVPFNPRRRAYVIYTSGSTGQPKGVEIEHRSLTNLVCFYHERLQLTSADRTTLLANPAFDASVADFWPALCAGGTVLVPDSQLLAEPDRLIAWLADEGAAFTFLPTAIGELLFARPWPKRLALRHLCIGGETLRLRPPPGFPFAVINSYGPTENTVDATWEIVDPEAAGLSGRPGIGRPIANVRAYVLDAALKPVALGVEGELFLGGVQVARGYLNRPDLTRERFLPDPFADAAGARMYRTGDVVRWRTDGSLEFLGRNDDQVQIRGQRAELGEIEAALRRHPAVREACCRPLVDKDGAAPPAVGRATGVAAHVVAPGMDHDKLAAELRQFLGERLPDYMVPVVFVPHPALPLTSQGKVDRAALDAAVSARMGRDESGAGLTSEDSLVQMLTQLWHRILPDGAGRPDRTFQESGGDSLGAVKLLLGLEEVTSRRLPLSTFLLEPTLAGLCRAATAAEDASRKPILALRRSGSRPPIFCLYNLGGDVDGYFELVAELGGDQPVYGIRSPALHHLERKPDSIESAAREVRGLLKEFWPRGPFALVGFSWAGILAFEVARQMGEEDGAAPFCALLGSAAPTRQLNFLQRLGFGARWGPLLAWRLMRESGFRWERWRKAGSLRFLRKFATGEKASVPPWAAELSPLATELIKLAYCYHPAVSRPVPIHLFRERNSMRFDSRQIHFSLTNHLEDGGWGYWARRKPEIHWLDGEHIAVIKQPLVKETARELRAALARHFDSA